MNNVWPMKQLQELADIRVSNVDKKFYVSEKPVRLCNYMDVYSNEYVTNEIQFMEASATPAEIERFSLRRGDVIITKDSETPDDIGIPAVILEEIDNLVCGYHLAVIRPNKEELDPIFLAKQLYTSRVARYFAMRASGSTRFGLPISAIEAVEIPTPSKSEQTQIAAILSTIDRAIEQTEAIIAKQQRIKTGLMQDLLTRGIDDQGNIRSEATHEFKDSPLGRIPVEWEVGRIEGSKIALVDGDRGENYAKQDDFLEDGYCLFLSAKNVTKDGFVFDSCQFITQEKDNRLGTGKLQRGDVVVTTRGTVGNLAFYDDSIRFDNIRINSGMLILRNFEPLLIPEFLYQSYKNYLFDIEYLRIVSGSAQPQLPAKDIKKFHFIKPSLGEQKRICVSIRHFDTYLFNERKNLEKLQTTKTGLMQDLLTGQVRVGGLEG